MAANLPAGYFEAEEEYRNANSNQDRLIALKKMLSAIPKHKDAQKVVSEIKIRIAKLKKKMDKQRKQRKRASSLSIKKQGAAQVCLVGIENSGKSYLLNNITNIKIPSTKVPFETTKPVVSTGEYKKVKIQFIEIPSIKKNFSKTKRGLIGIIRNCDLIAVVLDIKKDSSAQRNLIKKELEEVKKPFIELDSHMDNVLEKVWNSLNLIKIFTKLPGKEVSKPPLTLKKNGIIKDVGKEIHKDFLTKFKFARVWGKSAKFPGQRAGLNHKLKDNDIVEFHLEK